MMIMVGSKQRLSLLSFLVLLSIHCSDGEENTDQNDRAQQANEEDRQPPCELWLGESSLVRGAWGLYSGIPIAAGEVVGEGETLIPLLDINDREWSSWHDVAWSGEFQADLYLQNEFKSHAFLAGIGSLVTCAPRLENVHAASSLKDTHDTANVHRSTHASAGSFGDRYPLQFLTTQDVLPGQELFTNCKDYTPFHTDRHVQKASTIPRMLKPLKQLQSNGICLDGISVKDSTIEGAGRGAFANRVIRKGQTITSSPVLLFDRSQMEIVATEYLGEKRWKTSARVKAQQLLLNYCHGHVNSTVLLLPYGPGINFINHAPPSATTTTPSSEQEQPTRRANAILDWSESLMNHEDLLEMTAYDILVEEYRHLIVDLVALEDIAPGEEIFIDYGSDWQQAWDDHVKAWRPPIRGSKDSASPESYKSAVEYARQYDRNDDDDDDDDNNSSLIRTLDEQETDPYPDKIMTACFFQEVPEEAYDENAPFQYERRNYGTCLRPCKIETRHVAAGKAFYDVRVEEMTSHFAPDHCALAPHRSGEGNNNLILRVPEHAITLVDKPYSTDQFMQGAFRHPIGIPHDMYPQEWMSVEEHPNGEFVISPHLQPGQLSKIYWNDDGLAVTDHAYLLGLEKSVRMKLLEYCDHLGITEMFRDLTYRGNALRPGSNSEYTFTGGTEWYIQRPPGHWNSNMHWISPLKKEAHESYLQALSAAGFDHALQAIGETLGLRHLAAYHVTFIGVSECSQGYVHKDISNTNGRVFNVIIPLLLANETPPELYMLDGDDDDEENEAPVGRLRYQYDVASLMGDYAYHGTSAVDYRLQKEMRMAATVYVAEIDMKNIVQILNDYTQNYPPRDNPTALLKMAGAHWQRDDPNVKLPKPEPGHVLRG